MRRRIGDLAARLRPGDVHVWQADLSSMRMLGDATLHTLSADERLRADGYVFDNEREKFILRRCMLRRLLGEYLGTPPKALRFRYGPAGKPELVSDAQSAIRFNLSRSGSVVICVLARERDVGVDVERLCADVPAEIVDHFFSPREAAAFLRYPSELQRDAFFACWTRKEACLKAAGRSVSDLNCIDVPVSPLLCSMQIPDMERSGSDRRWRLHDLRTYEGYRASLVVSDPVDIGGPFEFCDVDFEARALGEELYGIRGNSTRY
jgi:4'-phosphopantetheinyl transferase